MHILKITGGRQAGKTAAASLLIDHFDGTYIQVTNFKAARQGLAILKSARLNNLVVDCDRDPSESFLQFVEQQARRLNVKHLVICHP